MLDSRFRGNDERETNLSLSASAAQRRQESSRF
jgi:hypothetical protein